MHNLVKRVRFTGRQICPPQRPSMAAAIAATAVPSSGRRFSGEWWKDTELVPRVGEPNNSGSLITTRARARHRKIAKMRKRGNGLLRTSPRKAFEFWWYSGADTLTGAAGSWTHPMSDRQVRYRFRYVLTAMQ